jgi:transcriptional regulator with XRE-family HTH domain
MIMRPDPTFAYRQMDLITRKIFSAKLENLMNGENPYNKVVNVQELAEGICMTRQAITKYLNLGTDNPNSAVPSILVLKKIAHFFGVTPNYLLAVDADISADGKLQMTEELLAQTGIERKTFEKLCALKSSMGDSDKYDHIITMVNAVIRGTLNELSEE